MNYRWVSPFAVISSTSAFARSSVVAPVAARSTSTNRRALSTTQSMWPPAHRVGLARAPEGKDRMKVVMRDGAFFQGTALQIVKAMQDIAFGVEQIAGETAQRTGQGSPCLRPCLPAGCPGAS